MPHLEFTLPDNLPETERARLLTALAAQPGVTRLTMIDPDSPVPEVRNLGILEVSESADTGAILHTLQSLTEPSAAGPAAQRRLIRRKSSHHPDP